jgi:hypothetical protein
MAANFGKVVYIHFYSKPNGPYNIGSTFLVAIQWYMARWIWRKNDQDMVGQSYGVFELTLMVTT